MNTAVLTVRIPPELLDSARDAAEADGTSLSDVTRQALDLWLRARDARLYDEDSSVEGAFVRCDWTALEDVAPWEPLPAAS